MVDKFNYVIEGTQVNAESITVPSESPYKVLTVHDHIKKDEVSSVEIWENNNKSGTQLIEEAYTGTVSGTGKFQVDYEGEEETTGMKRCSTILFHSAQAGSSWYIWYKSTGDEAEAGDINGKADKDDDAVEGNLAKFDSSGNPIDSGISPSNLVQGLSLIQNGSFEIVDSGGVPWCWEKIGTATLAQDAGVSDGFGGSSAIKVTSAGASNEGAKYTFRHLKPSTTYSIRIWIKATAGDTAKAWTTGGSSNLSITSTDTTGEYKTGSFTTDATPTNVVLNVGSETNGDIVWFDALTIIEGSTAPDKYLPSPQPTVFEFQDFYPVTSDFPGLETLVGTNILKKYVYALDDTTEEPLGFNFSIPPNFDPSGFIMLECVGWAKTAAASKNIEYTYYYSPKKYGEDWDTDYSSLVSGDLALYSTQDYRDNLRFQLSINTAGFEAYDVVESKISRTAPSANNLSGDYYFEKLRIWIPRV
jgi:hypothetical protein